MKRKIFLICALTLLLVLTAITLTACSADELGGVITPSVAIVNPTKTHTSIGFDILETDPLGLGAVTKIELTQGDNDPVVAENVNVRKFDGLLSGTKYTVKITYKYSTATDGEDETVVKTLDITTESKEAPSISIINVNKTEASIGFDILELDKDSVGQISKIELSSGSDAPIELTDLTKREFTGLSADTKYTVKVTYKYDLNDGVGEKTLTAAADIYTDKPQSKEAPMIFLVNPVFTTDSVGFEALIIDKNNVGHISKIELLHGSDTPIELADLTKREFTGLLSDNKYTVRVTYKYDLGDGAGEKTLVATLDITTEKEKAPELYFIGALSDKTAVYFELLELDQYGIGEIIKIDLLENGEPIETVYDADTRVFTGLNSNTLYTVKVTYAYDFDNGNGVQYEDVSIDIATLNTYAPIVYLDSYSNSSTYVSFELEIIDVDDVGCTIEKIELLRNGAAVQTALNSSVREFSNLLPETEYTVRVTYSYNLGDGNGKITEIEEIDVMTSAGVMPNWSSKTDVRTTWSGETLNIACSTWSASPGAPWSVMELCIDYGKQSGFGELIDAAVLERQEFIDVTYGVELNWINATRFGMHDALETAMLAGNINYDLAMTRAMRAQSIVSGGYVYDMANREFINFDQPYYNANSVEAYTAKGHTFFVAGDFSNLHYETAFALYFNKNLLEEDEITELYQMVRDGSWTWNELVTLANGRYSDDGDGVHGDTDTYGFSTTSLNRFFDYFGVKQAGVNQSTGEWMITINDPKVDNIISAIITANTANWCRSAWGGSWGSNAIQAFNDNRLLFLNEVIQISTRGDMSGNVGVIPFPKLNAQQENYYVPCAMQQTVLMCIPKITQDRGMSDYFLDVLSWTGREYTIEAYLEHKSEYLVSPTDIEMLKSYIFPNVIFDAGAAVGWGDLIGQVKSSAWAGNTNCFIQAYEDAAPDALQVIESWNNAWGRYTE